jgi:hypothetical protein
MLDLAPPACPTWCENRGAHGWDAHPSAMTKTCTVAVSIDCRDGEAVSAVLERFAAIEFGEVVVEAPAVRLDSTGRIDAHSALRLAGALVSLVTWAAPRQEMASSSGPA